MKKILQVLSLILLSSCCTFNFTNVSSVGNPKDLIDQEQTQDQDPNLAVQTPNIVG